MGSSVSLPLRGRKSRPTVSQLSILSVLVFLRTYSDPGCCIWNFFWTLPLRGGSSNEKWTMTFGLVSGRSISSLALLESLLSALVPGDCCPD